MKVLQTSAVMGKMGQPMEGSISSYAIGLLRLFLLESDSIACVSLGIRLSNLLAYSCSLCSFSSFLFLRISSNVSSFISNSSYLRLFFVAKCLLVFSISLKNQLLASFIISVLLFSFEIISALMFIILFLLLT